MRIRKTKRFGFIYISILFLYAAVIAPSARADNESYNAPAVHAEAAVLMDMESGEFVYERNADKRMLIASTTKIMTALVAIDGAASATVYP
jgi:D-alanyl-D-alanine carboxypeptidase